MKFDYYKKAKYLLERNPDARNIDNRAKAVWVLFKKHINPNIEVLDKYAFVKYFSNLQSFDRAIRDVQQDNPHLKWNGNLKNQQLEVNKLKELGY